MTEREAQLGKAVRDSFWDTLVKAQQAIAFDTSIEAGNLRIQIENAFTDLDRGMFTARLRTTVDAAEIIVAGSPW